MRARIDISEVEIATKIRAKYLRAIENEEWDLLPGPVYVKSFLRSYGDYLGLDSRMLVDEYKRRYERPSDHDMRPLSSLARERERAAKGPLIPSWAVIGGVLVAIVVALYFIGGGAGGPSNTPTVRAPAAPVHRPRHRRRPIPPALVPKPTTVKLELTPTGAVYVCLVDGTGHKLINEQTFSTGQTIPPATAPKLLLTLGNASVQMKVNGKSVPVAPSANAIRLLLTPGSIKPIPLSMTPTCP